MSARPASVTPRPQAERSSASTEAMLNAAIELILKDGGRVSMMAIGQRSGFSHGLVLARFGSKAGLIRAVTQRVQQSFVAEIDSAVGDAKGLAGLLGLVDAFFRMTRRAAPVGGAFYVLLGESLREDPVLREAYGRADGAFRRYVAGFLRQASESGELSPAVSVPAAAALIVGMLRGTGMQKRLNPQAFDLDPVHEEARAFVERLRAPPQASRRRRRT